MNRNPLLACKDGSCGAIFRKCQSTHVQMDANVFKDNFWQLQIFVLYVFRTVGQQGLVSGRNGCICQTLHQPFRSPVLCVGYLPTPIKPPGEVVHHFDVYRVEFGKALCQTRLYRLQVLR